MEAFRFFHENRTGFVFSKLSDDSFSMAMESQYIEDIGSEDALYHAHMMASSFLVALNIATVGYFCWRSPPAFHPIYHIQNNSNDEERHIALYQERKITFDSIRDLTDLNLENAIIIFGSLVRDEDSHSRIDYLKGLLHISASHLDIDFNREAFGNFYRCMEAFVTRKVLRVKTLSNEVKDIQRALKQIGAGEDLTSTFKEIYAIRSNQVAHAQKKQAKVEFHNVLGAKAFADMVMHKTYRRQAEEWRATQQA
jgi:hypothetical protein